MLGGGAVFSRCRDNSTSRYFSASDSLPLRAWAHVRVEWSVPAERGLPSVRGRLLARARRARRDPAAARARSLPRSEEHTSELQSLMRTSYAVFCLKKKKSSDNVVH